jgi:phosphoribosylformimino-5-aminoimidazole carboxamide ribotide isomerase
VILYPAIDIRGGQAVRLLRGDYAQETTYDADPTDAAKRWAAEGAEYLHVVDLDGAKAGELQNLDAIERIASSVSCPIQVGGGLRTAESVQAVLDAGAKRVVIGTAALKDPDFLKAMLREHGGAVVVSIDAKQSWVALEGWTEAGETVAAEAVASLGEGGVPRFLYTAIEVDGTMEGPAIAELTKISNAAPSSQIIASGGVGTLDHLRTLAISCPANVEGAIVGRALYEQKFTVSEAIAALRV